MEKQVKHSENYIGTFSQNTHVAQCHQCHGSNSAELYRTKSDPELTAELVQEWYQRKTMKHYPAEKQTFQNGTTKIEKEMFFCSECVESWGNAYEGMDYHEWSDDIQRAIENNTKPINIEILN